VTVGGGEDARTPDQPGEDSREPTLTDLLRVLGQDTRVLIRQEAELAKVELRDKAKTAASSTALFVGAALLGLVASGALAACAVLTLALVLPPWAAALIVAVVTGIVAALLAFRGRDRLRSAMPPLPELAIRSVREDIEWAKQQTRSTAPSPQRANE
jgi:hypothetical protein